MTNTTEERFSDRLLAMLSFDATDSEGNDSISMQDIVTALKERGFGLLIILLSLPSAIPGVPPPIPSIFAMPVAVLTIQMMMRYSLPKLPEVINRKTVKRSQLNAMVAKFHSYLRHTDFLIKPRIKFLTSPRNEPMIGAIMFFFTLIVIIPLPLTNSVPSIATIIMSVGIISRDGLFLIAGIVIGFAWSVFLFFLSTGILDFIKGLFM
jgi:hypothetical protein